MHLALLEDRLGEGARLSLPAAPRVIYVVTGRVTIDTVTLGENETWHGAAECAVHAAAAATVATPR